MTRLHNRHPLQFRPIWWLLLLLLILRIPTFNRPLSKHHDFNNAVILINAASWQQAGGGSQCSFTPLMNFQGAENKLFEKGYHVDSRGNHVYLSFGPGWYLLPYAIFNALHITASPAALELINIFIGLITTLLLYLLLHAITQSQQTALCATAIFAFAPAPLWFLGHSYVTTGIMQPLVIWILWLWLRLANHSHRVSFSWHAQLLLAGLLLIYTDWVGVFLMAGMFVWSVLNARKRPGIWTVTITTTVVAVLGVFLILWQFSTYLGWPQVLGYWQSRFGERSMQVEDKGMGGMAFSFIRFLASGYGLLLLLAAWAVAKRRKEITHVSGHLSFALGAVLVYHIVLLNWSLVHEFAWLTFALLVTIIAASLSRHWLESSTGMRIIAAYAIASVAIYFYVNKPGQYSQNGDRYDGPMNLGQQIHRSVPADAVIFTNLSNAKIEEWYAGRTFNHAVNLDEAKKIAGRLQGHAVWMQVEHDTIRDLQTLK